jgi:REP element-mobilizing transposase RayT
MARPPRDIDPGIFHVTCHGVRDTALFRDDIDRVRFLTELAAATARAGWTCIEFCQMTTHFHLLVDVDAGILPIAMQRLNFRYACAFNTRHGTRGHVLERRYSAGRIASERHLLAAFRYIARNPVVAKLCMRPQEWPWSSYAATVGLADPIAFVDASCVLRVFGGPIEVAIGLLRDFVEEP